MKDVKKLIGNRTYTIYEDGGHAWIKVPVAHLFLLGSVVGDITPYSYIYRHHAYLEEDCDLTKFLNAYHAVMGRDPKYKTVVRVSGRSKVRSYPRYTPERALRELP